MAESKVRAPDGSVIKIRHPDNATKEEIIRNAEILFSRKQQTQESDARARDVRLQTLRRTDPGEFDPNSKEFRDKFGAASGGFSENLAAGSGKALFDLGRGTRQIGVEGANLIPGIDLDDFSADLRQRATETRSLDRDLLQSGGGLTGNIGTNIGLALLPGGLASGAGRAATAARSFSAPATLRAAMSSGALQGALQPVAEDESRAFNVGAGAAFGGVGNKIARPFTPNLGRGQSSAIDTLTRAGVPLDVAERTGSTAAQRFANMLDDSAISAGSRSAFKETQQEAFTRAALSTIGESADEATPTVMQGARSRIGSVFNNVAKSSGGIRADAKFMSDAQRVYANASRTLLGDEMNLFDRNFREVMDAIDNGLINPSRFNSAMSRLGKLSGRQNVGQAVADLEEILLDALGRSSPADIAALDAAKAQWRNLRIIQGAIGKGEERFISPIKLSATMGNKSNQNLSVFGLGRAESRELSDLARAGREILQESPNSGTALRQQVPTGAALGGSLALGGIPGLLAGAGAIRGASGAMNSQGLIGNYLAGGLPSGASTPITQLLIRTGLLHQSDQMQE